MIVQPIYASSLLWLLIGGVVLLVVGTAAVARSQPVVDVSARAAG